MVETRTRKAQKAPSNKEQGASHLQHSWRQQLVAYRHHHISVAKDSLDRMLRLPLASMMTWLVIGIALALPAGFYVALSNLDVVGRGWDTSAQLSLFLSQELSPLDAAEFSNQMAKREDVARVQFISSAKALEEFQQLSGFGDVLQSLESNPLPAVVIINPNLDVTSPEELEKLLAEFQQMSQVEHAQLDLEWLQRMFAILELGSTYHSGRVGFVGRRGIAHYW